MHLANIELFSEPLIAYLKNRGWMQMDTDPDIAILRKVFIDQEEEIVLPIDRRFSDYRKRVLEAIHFLAKHECRSEEDIIDDLIPPKWDVLRIKIKGDRIGDGWISYLDKGSIEEGVRKLLFASARSVIDPKPYFKRLYSISAEQWMKKCRAGTAQSGSYILTVQLPLTEESDSVGLPFSRRVTEYLMSSLGQLVELSEHPDTASGKAESHLNANLCLGLAEMKPDENPIQFDFEMKWSSEIPVNKNIPAKVEIRDHHFPSIMRIGQKLKPQTEINQDNFVGKVLTLNGEADEQGNMQGEATLVLFIDEQQTKAKVYFGSAYYSIACDAHKQNQYVRISGILSEKPRCSDLKDVSLFEILK